MSGQCYEEIDMLHEEARVAQFEVLKNQYTDHEELQKVIKEVVHNKVAMGSYHDYWTFRHKEFKLNIKERYEYLNRKIK